MLDYEKLHALSFENEELVKKANTCGCFYCGRIFNSSEVINWCEDANARTAICPYCNNDSVLQESNDGSYELNKELLFEMNQSGLAVTVLRQIDLRDYNTSKFL